jgi:hypothetical protein
VSSVPDVLIKRMKKTKQFDLQPETKHSERLKRWLLSAAYKVDRGKPRRPSLHRRGIEIFERAWQLES